MASLITILGSIFLFIVALTTIIVLILYFYNKHGKNDELEKLLNGEKNRPLVLNFTPQTENLVFEELKSDIKESGNRNNTVVCKSYKVSLDKDGNPVLPAKAMQTNTITTSKGRRIPFARGTLDEDREIIVYLPEQLHNTDDAFKNTKLYKLIEPLVMQNDALENSLKMSTSTLQKIQENLDFLLTSYSYDDRFVEKIQNMKSMISSMEDNQQGGRYGGA